MIEPIRHALLEDPSGRVRHGFFGRAGGVSNGLYRSLNCGYGSGDDPEAIAENRARAMSACGLAAGGALHRLSGPQRRGARRDRALAAG